MVSVIPFRDDRSMTHLHGFFGTVFAGRNPVLTVIVWAVVGLQAVIAALVLFVIVVYLVIPAGLVVVVMKALERVARVARGRGLIGLANDNALDKLDR